MKEIILIQIYQSSFSTGAYQPVSEQQRLIIESTSPWTISKPLQLTF